MPSENYRYYCLDAGGQLHDVKWFNAESDEDAIALIKADHPDSKCEIWQGKRLVATIGPGPRLASRTEFTTKADRTRSTL